jgi:hypothetical protein
MFDSKNKGSSQDTDEVGAEAVGATVIDGFKLSREFADGKSRTRDIEIGTRLGFARERSVRQLIKTNKKLSNVMLRHVAQRDSLGRARVVTEYWLTRTETLILITLSETEIAHQLTDQIIAVFEAFLDGKLTPQTAAPDSVKLDALIAEVRSLRASVDVLQSGPGSHTGAISPTQYRALRSDAGTLARWEHRAGLAPSVAAARASIDQDLRSRTGWGGKARPWTTLPIHLLAEARTVLRERMQRMRAQLPEGAEQLALPYDPKPVKH